MEKFLDLLRAIFICCKHDWVFVEVTKVDEFIDSENVAILSRKEYSLQQCTLCGKDKYRKL